MTSVETGHLLPSAIDARPLRRDAADTAREFEAMFLSQTVDEMLKTVPQGLMGGGHAEEMWRSFFARAIAEEIADGGRTGVAQSVEAAITGYTAGSGEDGR
ncbi:rod-binding protein [Roseibacterium sp. SDUM158017]|uniref:rod-binding protein n=1 Tax=Roseicyclus salinarum TaxID=3036773 RepID=UPI0024151BCF|nr:rod-binding protein [Roseibacterium sp. SDUM158017]MDG4648644.1 rod-binding protein [Roseibacterium sp. SDUM158017]